MIAPIEGSEVNAIDIKSSRLSRIVSWVLVLKSGSSGLIWAQNICHLSLNFA